LSQHPQVVGQLLGEQGRKKAESYNFVLLNFDGCSAVSYVQAVEVGGFYRTSKLQNPKMSSFCVLSVLLEIVMVVFFFFSVKRETSVDFDMKKSISKTSFMGKNSAV